MDRKRRTREETRNLILATAKKCFAKEGGVWSDTTLDELTKQAGTGPAAIYQFLSVKDSSLEIKSSIFLALVEDILEQLYQSMWFLVAPRHLRITGQTPTKTLGIVAGAAMGFFANDPLAARIIFRQCPREVLLLSKGYKKISRLLRIVVRIAQKNGAFTRDLPTTFVRDMLLGWIGALAVSYCEAPEIRQTLVHYLDDEVVLTAGFAVNKHKEVAIKDI